MKYNKVTVLSLYILSQISLKVFSCTVINNRTVLLPVVGWTTVSLCDYRAGYLFILLSVALGCSHGLLLRSFVYLSWYKTVRVFLSVLIKVELLGYRIHTSLAFQYYLELFTKELLIPASSAMNDTTH